MSAKYVLVSLLAILMMAPTEASGQILKDYLKSKKERAKDRATDKADDKVDEKVDEGVDKVFKGVGNLFKKKSKGSEDGSHDTASEDDDSEVSGLSLFSGGGDVETRDHYDFDYKVHMSLTVYDKKGKGEETEMMMVYPREGAYMGADMSSQGAQGVGIFDFENEVMVTLVSGRALAMDLEKYKAHMSEEADEEAGDVSIKRTGRTKSISGYACEEYIVESEDVNSEMWVTNELPFNPYESFMELEGVIQANYDREQISGFPMEMTTTSNDGQKSNMVVTEVNEERVSFDMADYPLLNMGNMGGFDDEE